MTVEELEQYWKENKTALGSDPRDPVFAAVQVKINCGCGYCPRGRKFMKGPPGENHVVYLYDHPQDQAASTYADAKHLYPDKEPGKIWLR